MTVIINSHGEFVDGSDRDSEERRAEAYASLRAIDPKRRGVREGKREDGNGKRGKERE